MQAAKDTDIPDTFRYREVLLKGRPRHDEFDRFRIKHPRMDVEHRAKIFAPFDALKGFGEAISAVAAQVSDTDEGELPSGILKQL